MTKGYVYILSNKAYEDVLKVGMTSQVPEERAKSLSKATGVLYKFKVEWSKEVPNIRLAEYMLHHILHPYAVSREFFRLPLDDAKKICEEAMKQLFKPLKTIEAKKELFRIYALRNKAILIRDELKDRDSNLLESNGTETIPIGEKENNWEGVAAGLKYKFGKKAIDLCLREGRIGDPLRRRFISYRAKYLEMQRIDLFFTRNYLLVYVVTKHESKNKKMLRLKFGLEYKRLDFSTWKKGFSFKVSNEQQFFILKTLLQMGSKKKGLVGPEELPDGEPPLIIL